jgi:hypothetical protein
VAHSSLRLAGHWLRLEDNLPLLPRLLRHTLSAD